MRRQIGLALLVLLSGCSTLGYYGQAAGGQLALMMNRQSVPKLLQADGTSPELRQRLQLSQALLDFASVRLQLPAEGRYQSYVVTGRSAVVWNVVAAPELSLAPLTWCYPVVGCVPYRGFFSERRARREASLLMRSGYVVHVGGVPAYSTLGWFRDPLLDTFIRWPAADVANLLFHELAHSRVWVDDDANFNESLASFVGDQGARQWLAVQPDALAAYDTELTIERRFSGLLDGLHEQLQAVYAAPTSDARKRRDAAALYARFRACHVSRRQQLGQGRYDTFVSERLNNAYLASRRTYDQFMPAFAALFDEVGADWTAFWRAVEHLAGLDAEKRLARLQQLLELVPDTSGQKQVTNQGDHEHADEVECQPFTRHAASGELAG